MHKIAIEQREMQNYSARQKIAPFLSCVSTLTRDIDIANSVVRLSVCLSVRLFVHDLSVLDENGLTYCHSFFTSPVILVFQHQTPSQNSDGVTPCGGAKYRSGIKISQFSTNKSLYLAHDTR